ncbi:MAG: hypothetical protein A2Z21_07140 [Candidatus Fraserbacteria bacterium RBG_16_55_9]|uniref:Uncharacterized protein n=1 Tax=Fraserbacteria sp. (strain RBG_16_55_9) TaxID=1817864 RepID=A0A1F5USP9_FRAXR|nr:MAG: hypothetical protein A2Z21_07140 [Candidatus Fraserbacteria bacterium RBG_16_55_9]
MTPLLKEVPEAEATGEIKAIYNDIQGTLQVSTVPWLFRVLAAHPKYFAAMWGAIKPIITNQFEGASDDIRTHAVSPAMPSIQGSDHRARLKGSGYSREKIKEIQDQLLVYHFMNAKLLLIATVLKEASSGETARVRSIVVTPTSRGVPPGMPKVRMADPQKATGNVAEIFASVQASLELPQVSDEFHTLAAWPEYLELAWGELRRVIQAPTYERLLQEVRQAANRGRQELRRRVDLAPEDLTALGLNDAEQDEIKGKVDFFYRHSPTTVTAVAFWMLALAGPEVAMLSGEELVRQWALPQSPGKRL